MIRQIVKIDSEKCNGCGLCIDSCHEGAIAMVNGKAVLTRDDYCDGLGNCLPACPVNAITIEEREAAAFDRDAAMAAVAAAHGNAHAHHDHHAHAEPLACGCPGSASRAISHAASEASGNAVHAPAAVAATSERLASELRQWPVQIKLVPVNAPYFKDAHLLIAADCAAYAYANFHGDFMKNKITIVGCPKLDDGDYSEKLTEIIARNDLKSVTVVRMEVPCCGGIEHATVAALKNSGKFLPWQVVTLTTDGKIVQD